MWVPLLVMLFVAMTEIAKVGYTYYTLHKILYTVARYAGTSTGADFCAENDAAIEAIKNLAVNGGIDANAAATVAGLEASQIEVRLERRRAEDGALEACDCSSTGCDVVNGGRAADYVVVSIPDGYPVRLVVPLLSLDPIPLRPRVRVPYGGG
jgi:hypothetical protein